jgi:hypothetical protein
VKGVFAELSQQSDKSDRRRNQDQPPGKPHIEALNRSRQALAATSMQLADIIVETLQGVEHFYGVVGDMLNPIALARAKQ